jgi:hypothetical protein
MSADQETARRAARQHGVIARWQAFECGLTKAALDHRVAKGLLIVLHPGVYAVAGAPKTWEQSLMAARLAAGRGAVVSHRSAARLWKLTESGDDIVEITVPRPGSPRLRGVIVHRSTDLVPHHTMVWQRLPLTNPLRTIVDLEAVLRTDLVEDALDRGLIRRLYSIASIEWMRNELGRSGRNGAGAIRRILDERALGAEPPDGMLEPRMARLLRDAGLPPAAFQYVILTPDGRFLAVVDFAYPELRLAIEVDGYEVHGTPKAMARDFVRQNGLVRYRWQVLRFTWTQVVRSPGAVAAVIAEARAACLQAQSA